MINMKFAKRQNVIRFVASFLVVCLVSVFAFNNISTSVKIEAKTATEIQKEIDDKQKEIDAKEKELKNIANQISNTQKNQKKEQEKQVLLSSQIKSVEEQLEIYKNKIDLVTTDIANMEVEIANKRKDIEVNEEQFAQRVRAMYISNVSNSTLTTLLTAQSFSQFLNNAEILKRISQSDKDLISELSRQKTELDTALTNLETKKSDLTSTKNSYDSQNQNLSSLYQQSTAAEAKQKLLEKQYIEEKEKNKKEIEKMEAAVNELLISLGDAGEAPSAFKWPLPTSSRITSGYGWRTIFGKREFHLGIDIGDKAGNNIVASAAGEVVLVKKSSTGYGWHVVINHGGGYATLYAHASRIDVSVGQQVAKGQTIAGVGTTGASTGNHLHFEVRINSKQQPPLNYVKP